MNRRLQRVSLARLVPMRARQLLLVLARSCWCSPGAAGARPLVPMRARQVLLVLARWCCGTCAVTHLAPCRGCLEGNAACGERCARRVLQIRVVEARHA
jgi:hypothetical protein